jgi:hypothetical protein
MSQRAHKKYRQKPLHVHAAIAGLQPVAAEWRSRRREI